MSLLKTNIQDFWEEYNLYPCGGNLRVYKPDELGQIALSCLLQELLSLFELILVS